VHNKELRDLYFSPSIIRMNESRRIRWAGNVTQMREKKKECRLLVVIRKETTRKSKT
jgi:hypothetical protein